MVTEKEKDIAQEYLADKSIKGVWVNSAGELFFDEGLAKASDEEAEFIKKSKADQKESDTTATDKKDEAAEAQAAELKEKNLKLLAETELRKENYQTMKALVKFFEITTEDHKADTLITALTNFKETLKSV
ncbi:hypothetical protein J0383_07820 [Flavobacterium endoglycinae]|uniref:Phage protein n=1 Tax=Flavobacterium endoglycinae TaxID=2816357 RepID=A0ABX7QJE2_9FLAO|nr:hypothetical protein [Flavobacterium endoglycinae]QSW90706.1 hypothetical protein J0383_07820 [Flavobacterium endoglycinae]